MISTRDVRVDYDDVTAVVDLNLEIPAGEIFGLIGPNGAGKTSTIRVLATLQQPTYGEVRIAGIDAIEDPAAVHAVVGYMPDTPPVYDNLSCWEFLDLFAATYFVGRRERRRRIDDCLSLVDLQSKRKSMAGKLSLGMKQRLVLAKTLLPSPKVLLLDEPASGLDPLARIEMRKMLQALSDMGNTVLISSHILTELSELCTSIGIMEKGHLIESGRIDDIVERINTHRCVVIELLQPTDTLGPWLTAQDSIAEFKQEGTRYELQFTGEEADVAALLRQLVHNGTPVKSFYEQRMDVEDILLNVGAKEAS